MVRTRRQRLAGRFGMIEHRAGRWLGLFIFLVFVSAFNSWSDLTIVLSVVSFVTWVIYLGSHTIEKKLYGPGLRR